VGFRVASLGMEEGIMLVMVGMLNLNGTYVKIFAQFLVIMANYAFSKLFIFRKVKEEGC
jgi:putative flippase GtrA